MNLSDQTDDNLMPKAGEVVPFTFKWYFILVSWVVSFVGAMTFVELLHHRRISAGWRYW